MERGERPERPTDMGLADSVWALIEQCWDENPRNRPKMSDVSRTLRDWSAFLLSMWTGAHQDAPISRNDKRVLVSVLPPTPTDIDLHERKPRPYVNNIAAHKEEIQLILPRLVPRTSLG